jgi:hypothetical protein
MSSSAAGVPASSRGASASRAKRSRGSPTTSTGGVRSPVPATRTPASSSSGWLRPRTAETERGASSPATRRRISSFPRFTAPGSPPAARRRASSHRHVHRRGEPLRAARQQAHAGGAGQLSAVSRTRDRSARTRARRRCSRRVRLGRDDPGDRVTRSRSAAAAEIHARRRGRDRSVHDDRQLPPEPAEHVHREAHSADARHGVRSCCRDRRDQGPRSCDARGR